MKIHSKIITEETREERRKRMTVRRTPQSDAARIRRANEHDEALIMAADAEQAARKALDKALTFFEQAENLNTATATERAARYMEKAAQMTTVWAEAEQTLRAVNREIAQHAFPV